MTLAAAYGALVLVYLLLLRFDAGGPALAFHVLSRLAYFFYVGLSLRSADRNPSLTRDAGDERYRRFRRWAEPIMTNDAASLVLLCWVTRGTLPVDLAEPVALLLGGALVALGTVSKLWAAATVGVDNFYWRNFFVPPEGGVRLIRGPYRLLRNPMYTVGYLHTYGVAILLGSLAGLAASLFDHVLILVFYRWVERPHDEEVFREA